MPSMMVMVWDAPGVAPEGAPEADEPFAASPPASPGLPAGAFLLGARASADTTTMGSPPRGSSANTTQPAKATKHKPRRPAAARGNQAASAERGVFFGVWPRGVVRSSATAGSLALRCGSSQHGRTGARKRSGAAVGPPRLVSQRG